jgi:hypothetical protein
MFLGTPETNYPDKEEKSDKAEPLATEKTLRGMRDGQSIIQGDLFAINSKLGEKGAIFGALMDIANILELSGLDKLVNESKKTRKLLGQAFFGKKSRAKELTPEATLENTKDEQKAVKIEKEQTSLLAQINENVIKSMTGSGMWKWFSDNWGKLLAGVAFLTLPYEYWDKLGTAFEWGKDHPLVTAIGVLLGYHLGVGLVQSIGSAIGGAMFGGAAATGGVGLITKLFLGVKASALGGMASPLAIVAAMATAIFDGFSAMTKSEDWSVSKISAFLGGFFGGSEGWVGAFSNMGKYAVGGVILGMAGGPPGMIAGGLAGAAVGAIMNYIGAKRLAEGFDKLGAIVKPAWDGLMLWATDMFEFFIMEPIGWIKEKWAAATFMEEISKGWADMKKELGEVYDGVVKPFTDLLNWLILPENVLNFDGVIRIFDSILAKIQDMISSPINSLKSFFGIGGPDADTPDASKVQKIGGAPTPLIPPTGQILLDDKRANMSGWSGLSGQSKLNSQRMANMFGGLRITSGQRSSEQQAEAMVGMKSVDVYSSKWKKNLTDAERNSAPGTNERRNAVKKIQDAGYESNHKHGNAIDFSYPDGYSKKNFSKLQAVLQDAFPGSKLLNEKDHLHLAFKPGVAPDQISAGMNRIHEGGASGFSGAPPTYNVTNNISNSSQSSPSTTVIAGDSLRNKKDTGNWWNPFD